MASNTGVRKAVLGTKNWVQVARRHWVNNLDLLRQVGDFDAPMAPEFVVSAAHRVLLVEQVATKRNKRIDEGSSTSVGKESAA